MNKRASKAEMVKEVVSLGYCLTSYGYAKKAGCNASYAFKILERMVLSGDCHKWARNGKYYYSIYKQERMFEDA